MQQKVLIRRSLVEMIRRPTLDLYKEQRARTPIEEVVEQMRNRDIAIRMARIRPSWLSPALTKDMATMVVPKLVSRFKAGENLEVLDTAGPPGGPIALNRPALTIAGLISGLLLGGVTVGFRPHRNGMHGLQLSPEGGQQVKP